MTETWKAVVGFEGLYEVSDHGRVRSRARAGGRNRLYGGKLLKPKSKGHGYQEVTLQSKGARAYRLVHRLVLEAFVGPCPNGMEARHFPDRDPRNNRRANLSWSTAKTNHRDKIAHGTAQRGERANNAKLTTATVKRVRALVAEGCDRGDVAALIGITRGHVNVIAGRRAWKHVA